jgi:hypothetical protein
MLLSKRCPHTHVVNFYDSAEPHISIGSITRCGTSAAADRYTWRLHGAETSPAGHAVDASTAERSLRGVLVAAQRHCDPRLA